MRKALPKHQKEFICLCRRKETYLFELEDSVEGVCTILEVARKFAISDEYVFDYTSLQILCEIMTHRLRAKTLDLLMGKEPE